MEIWKFYKETNNRRWGKIIYEVSDLGNVKVNGKLINFINNKYYYRVGGEFVHRMVAKTFIPNPENKPCIDHINTNKHDNRAENLRWVTHKENSNNPLTLEYNKTVNRKCGHVVTNAEKTNLSKQNKKRKHMTNGIDRVFPLPDEFDFYLEKGYYFGNR